MQQRNKSYVPITLSAIGLSWYFSLNLAQLSGKIVGHQMKGLICHLNKLSYFQLSTIVRKDWRDYTTSNYTVELLCSLKLLLVGPSRH